jgi:hypothetical protein
MIDREFGKEFHKNSAVTGHYPALTAILVPYDRYSHRR